MLSWLIFLIPTSVFAAIDKTHGVHPSLISHYVPIASSNPPKWKCLNGSKEILWKAVNDDFCDCPDGSDEPGTGACPDTTFYCRNEGHIGAEIMSSRVNDGLCEIQCCDGSDEPSGVCPKRCNEIGAAYREKMEAELKIRKTGSKIRSTYITFAQKEKKRLETLINNLSQEVAVREKETAKLKDTLDRLESTSAAELEYKKESPLYQSLITHNRALKALQEEHRILKEKERTLADILTALRVGYNPNYQDMAVLEAVRGWEQYAHQPHINDAEKEDVSDSGEELGEDSDEGQDQTLQIEDDVWDSERLEKELKSLLNTDYVNLLLDHEEHIGASGPDSLLFNLTAYLPDFVIPSYENFKENLVNALSTVGIIPKDSDSGAATSQARTSYLEAERSLNAAKKQKSDAQEDLARLFDVDFYGKEGEWKKLDKLCLSKDTGDYTYEVCLFDEARQKPNKGGATFSLGKFYTWHPDVSIQPGEPEYYTWQAYRKGARCWNGPERSVNLLLTCGTENALTSVSEPEKCEYQITGTTPALCLPVHDVNENVKEEL